MKQLPNIITLLRIAGSFGLLFYGMTSVVFWIIYGLCGISDIADGWLARKLNCIASTGALLDSVADICFVACCAWQILPILRLPQWLWLWAGVIVVIKVVNQLSALAMYGRCRFPHTLANKWAGFLLFIAVPMTFWSIIPLSIAAIVATYAAIQEGHCLRMNKRFSKCENDEQRNKLTLYRPYKGSPEKLGTFASRSPERPNPIALTVCEVLNVDEDNGVIRVSFLAALDSTPIIDIKPYTPSLDRVEYLKVPEWQSQWPKSVEASGTFDWSSVFNF